MTNPLTVIASKAKQSSSQLLAPTQTHPLVHPWIAVRRRDYGKDTSVPGSPRNAGKNPSSNP